MLSRGAPDYTCTLVTLAAELYFWNFSQTNLGNRSTLRLRGRSTQPLESTTATTVSSPIDRPYKEGLGAFLGCLVTLVSFIFAEHEAIATKLEAFILRFRGCVRDLG